MAEEATESVRWAALQHLQQQLNVALSFDRQLMRDMSFEESIKFSKDHPGAHFVIGDFEIRCLNPEKYHL